ncbi:hypothetical protein [Streptomyces tateyamensis]|uniref:hypothetical protein n=1 Tax=Streptomyces tateyamensis TaxID=565073 RepID=UPI0015E8D989|nr:hypothetical protein [Streptomyces tateyamensis]
MNGIDRGRPSYATGRSIDLEGWDSAGIPLLRDPRELVTDLQQRHLPQPGTSVLAVLDSEHRVVASASVSARPHVTDGWQHRNALLNQLRRVTPHDLRLAVPRRTAVLLHCREGVPGWTEEDGAWMWALHDAASLHGLRCGAYLTLTPGGWHVFGDGRSGRTPHSGSWAERPLHTVSELPAREAPAVQPLQDYGRPGRGWNAVSTVSTASAAAEPLRPESARQAAARQAAR